MGKAKPVKTANCVRIENNKTPLLSHTLLPYSESQPWILTVGEFCLSSATKPYRILLKTSIHFPFTSMAVQKSSDFNKI